MLAIKSSDVRNNFRAVCEDVMREGSVIISRKKNLNMVLMSELEYSKLKRNAADFEYEQKLKKAVHSANLSFSIEELEAFETMNPDETLSLIEARKNED
jgi:PHD/YefM family antitoxin component YafN of YafNO toxin-antitoxin module